MASPGSRKVLWTLAQEVFSVLKNGQGLRQHALHTHHTRRSLRTKRTLPVVLTSHIEALGRPGQVVSVAPGYARNKLVPHRLALPAISKFLERVETELRSLPEEARQGDVEGEKTRVVSDEDIVQEAERIAQRLDAGRLSVRRDTGHKSNVTRQPVTITHIIDEVKRQMGIQLHEANLDLPAALTTIGDYEVPLRLPKGIRLPGEKEQIRLDVRVRRK